MSDPFGDGMPAGDYHSWSKPQGPPCPHCECCTRALCALAVEKNSACHWEGGGSAFDLSKCPCWPLRSAFRASLLPAPAESEALAITCDQLVWVGTTDSFPCGLPLVDGRCPRHADIQADPIRDELMP